MDYTSIHINGHLLSDDILRSIEQDNTQQGNRVQDFGIDTTVSSAIDYVWSALRNDWRFYNERSIAKDPYGTRRARDLMERLFQNLGYQMERQSVNLLVNGKNYDINYLAKDLGNLPFIVIGDRISEESSIDTQDRCSLDYRAKGNMRRKSAHATMLEYLNSTENVYGIISNGQTLRLIRNSGQLVKVTYIEFDLRRMLEEDKYTEFCMMFRLLHASRFRTIGDEPCIMERWFNMSIESGNRIRAGLSDAVKNAMELIGNAAVTSKGEGNQVLREALVSGECDATRLNKELIHFIYRLLFLFIIEDRGLIYQIPDNVSEADASDEFRQLCRWQELYKKYYQASRLRQMSELSYLRQPRYNDLWQGLMDTFHLFEEEAFGSRLGIKPLGGVLFHPDTLHFLKQCTISNADLLRAFSTLNEFVDDNQQRVRINYSSLDVEEFGSVYEGILEMRPFVNVPSSADITEGWLFGFVGGLDRQSTSSYYTRPDLVQNLIRTTLEPVIEERLSKLSTPEEKVRSLLSMKVCDAASGSGHIVLAMARTIAWHVCFWRTGEDNPASLDYREALREVIQRCVYAVDYNPDAVELCKVVLWIEGYCAGKPLSFLDHHIRCGNSVVGVTDLDALLQGVPKEAFASEDRETKRRIIELNREALRDVALVQSGQQGQTISLFTQDFTIQSIDSEQIGLAKQVNEIANLPENNLLQQLTKQQRWEELMKSPRVECLRRACDVFTYSFYKQFTPEDLESHVDETGSFTAFNIPYTRTVFQALQEIKYLDDDDNIRDAQRLPDSFRQELIDVARQHRFFHWCVEFPEVFAYNGGFDVMCGNPPWDKIKIEDEKWFAKHNREDIAYAKPASFRQKLISHLSETDPSLNEEYRRDLQINDCINNFVRFGGRFNCAEVRDVDLYLLFAELCLSFTKERWGLVIPTGIAVNDSNKDFFARLVKENRLCSLYDFENKEALFDIHRMFKFCLLTVGNSSSEPRNVSCGFYLSRIDHLLDSNRIYTIKTSEITKLNPNTSTCPTFRTQKDAEITTKIYNRCSILQNDLTGDNPWDYRTSSMFHMTNDSGNFRTFLQLKEEGFELINNTFRKGDEEYIPLYEGKMINIYNHHFGSWPTEGNRPNSIPMPDNQSLNNPSSSIMPWYWVSKSIVEEKFKKTNSKGNVVWEWKHKWIYGFRVVGGSLNSRTFIGSIMPRYSGVGNSITLMYSGQSTLYNTILQAMMSSITFDYVVRQKVGGINMSTFFVKQFPILRPEQIPDNLIMPIVNRVIGLCYFNHDLDGWAEELYEELTDEQKLELPRLGEKNPYIYDPDNRAVLQAELDAIFAHLYGLSTEDLHYILDPEDVCGEGCINETFRVLKDNELRQFGEYRTKRLVLEAWNKFGFDN